MDESAAGYLDSFVKMIEDSFPYGDVYYRLAKDDTSASSHSLEFEEAYKVAEDMIGNLQSLGISLESFLSNMDRIDFFEKYPEVVKKVREEHAHD